MRQVKQEPENHPQQEFDRSENERREFVWKVKQDSENLSRQEFERSEERRRLTVCL
jgi:hypothetical protein